MRALIVYESMYGNTRQIAEALADGLRDRFDVDVIPASHAPGDPGVDLLVVGGPTHAHGLTSGMTRRMAAKAGEEDGAVMEPDVTAERGLREWLKGLSAGSGHPAVSFDTRVDQSSAMTGSAARGIARRLRLHHYHVLASQSFFVEDTEGPLADGELDRAREWAAALPVGTPART